MRAESSAMPSAGVRKAERRSRLPNRRLLWIVDRDRVEAGQIIVSPVISANPQLKSSAASAEAQGPPEAAPNIGGTRLSSRDSAAVTCASSIEDPLEYGVALPWTARYYPMGIPVDIETNSAAVLGVADQIWGGYASLARTAALTDAAGVTFRIAVSDRDAVVAPFPSMPLGQGHLVTMVQGPSNFAVCDLRTSFGFARLTRDVAGDSVYFRYHFLEPAVYVMISARYLSPLHAACVEFNGRALVLCGNSGAGKTTLAYACATKGWKYLSDDATHIVRGRPDHTVAGRPLSIRFRETARNLFPELKAWTPERRPNGKLDLEISTRDLGLATTFESKACGVVFLNRESPGGRPRIVPFPAADALEEFSRAVCFGDDAMRADQTDAFRRFTELPIVELTYGSPDSAERALRALVS